MSPLAPHFLPLTSEDVTRLAALLSAEELGFAVRLVAYHAAFGAGVPDEIITTYLGVTRKRWEKLRPSIEKAFELRDGRWTMTGIAERLAARQSIPATAAAHDAPVAPAPAQAAAPVASTPAPTARRQRGAQTLPLIFPAGPTGPRTEFRPAPPQPAETPSIVQTIFKLGVNLLTENGGRSESTARGAIAKMLQEYDVGYVAAAINDAWQRRERIVEPYSWIKKRLQSYPSKDTERTHREAILKTSAAARPVTAARPLATPEFLGLSEGMAARIRETNAAIPKFTYVDPAADAAQDAPKSPEDGSAS